MKRDYKLYIQDMFESITLIKEYTKNISFENFEGDKKLQDAVIRRLEIIGEAVRNLPRIIKQNNKGIAWDNISNYRDFITHNYFGVSLNRVWAVISELDDLKLKLSRIKTF